MSGYLTPDSPPAGKFYTRRLLIPADNRWLALVDGALSELTKAYNFQQYGTMTPEQTADYFDAMYQQYVVNVNEAPEWEDADEADGEPEQPWYDSLADWIIEAFLAITGFPTAAVVYSTTVPKIRIAFRTGNFGALFRVLLDNLEIYTGDSYAPITGLLEHTLDLQGFATANGLGPGPWTVRIEHNGPGANLPPGDNGQLQVIRKRLTDGMPIQFRQSDPCLLEYSEDGGQTWFTAADLSLCAPPALMTGAMIPWPATTIPTGWLECNGQAVSRTTYADLHALIGVSWGIGDGSTTFNVPDFRSRSLVGRGQGAGLTNRSITQQGGEENHLLSVNEMPSHSHQEIFRPSGVSIIDCAVPQVGTGTVASNVSTGAAGGGAVHNNMHPYAVVPFIIKT